MTPLRRRLLLSMLPLLLGASLLAAGCTQKKARGVRVLVDTTGLRNGDLLFRNGHGYESRVVTDLSSGNYSHIGIAYHDGNQWCVLHAVPGEAPKGEPDYLKCDPVGEFFRPDRAKAGARARIDCDDSIAATATRHALEIVHRKVPFDHKYNLEDTSSLYCTELIRLVYSDCGIDLCEDRWHKVPIHAKGPVIFPEDIWNSALLIDKIRFKTTY